jgi:hypothetical protein
MNDNNNTNKVEYLVACIADFARKFNISNWQAYSYLHRFKGFSFLDECYEAEHTLSIDDAINDIMNICHRNGGKLVA